MKHLTDPVRLAACGGLVIALAGWAVPVTAWAQASAVYYVCPGNVFTNTLTPREADQRGCKTREASSPTVIRMARPVRAEGSTGASGPPSAGGNPNTRVQQAEQRARDSDARRILEEELRKEEATLEAMRKDYNNGEPDRRGDERNAQKYLDRVAEMKAAITRKEADIAAIRRELAKFPS